MTPIFGLCVLDFWEPKAVAAIIDLGVKWVRIDFDRASIEPSPGVYNWSDYDTFMLAMEKAGVQVLAQITNTPTWIPWSDEAASLADIDTFFGILVNRYKPGGGVSKVAGWGTYGISYWEVFNEPNLPGYGWDPNGSLDYYAEALAAAAAAIRWADGSAKVVLGGLSSSGTPNVYMDDLYGEGITGSFDVFAFHPYGWDGRFPQLAGEIASFMATNGDIVKPIWFDEYGTSDPTQQIKFLQDAWAARNSVAAIFWFSLTDLPGNTTGLLTTAYVEKPVYPVFKGLMQQQ